MEPLHLHVDQETSHSPDNTRNKSSKKVFYKKPGTTDEGKDYENYVVASMVLKMVADESTTNFNMSSNDPSFGDFDDVVFEIENSGKLQRYAMQLKHTMERKKISLVSLAAAKGNFSLQKYFTSFQKLGSSVADYMLILMTNRQFDFPECTEMKFDADNVSFIIEIIKCDATPLLNLNKTMNNCYKFRIREDMNNTTDASKLHEYKTFFDQFFLYPNQSNVHQLESEISEQLKELLPSEAIDLKIVEDKYLKFISKWSLSEGKKHQLYKTMMQRILALYLATPFIHPICFGPVTENGKILQQAISTFDVTIFDKESTDNVKKLWGDVKDSMGDISTINKKSKKYQIDDFSPVNDTRCTELLWITNKCPLIVSASPAVYEAVNLCRDRKFVLIGADPIDESLKKYSIFHKLSDFADQKDVFKHLSTKFMCSLPGQDVNLEYLLQQSDEFHKIITTNELLEMVDHPYKIITEREELSEHYVSRQLSKNIIDFKYLNAADNKSIIVISNVRTERDLNNLQNLDLIDVDDYLEAHSENNKKLQMHYQEQLEFSERRNFFIKKNVCSQEEIRKLCLKKNNKNYHHFRICDGMLEWVKSTNDVSQLKQHRIEGHFIEIESELNTKYFQNNMVHLIADNPGMGKSWLMKSLKNKFLAEVLTIILSPADMLKICKLAQEEDPHLNNIENLIIDLKYSNYKQFSKHVLKSLMQNGQVIYLWDALDEISFDKEMTAIIKLIVKISENNCTQWLTCRRHLKNILESEFNVLSRTISQFNEKQQTVYIQKCLKFICPEENLNDVVIKIKSNIAFVKHKDILSIPLQIYMLTELFRQNRVKYLNLLRDIFSITDLYQHFIEEKFNASYKKEKKINIDDSSVRMPQQTKSLYINQYEKAALKLIIIESEFLEQLNINCNDILITQEEGDPYGFVTEMEGQFAHISYAEYFVATYFSKRRTSQLSDILFQERYSNVRFFFDMLLAKNSPAHIAVLYNNLPELKKCGDEILRKDFGGRSPLHIACSWGERYPVLQFKRQSKTFLLDEKTPEVKEENLEYRQMLEYLLTRYVDMNETDDMFNMSSLSYARKCNCLFTIATIEHRKKIGYFNSDDDNFNCSILLYSVIIGLDEIINLFENIKHIETKGGGNLLHLACVCDQIKVANLLLISGIDVNAKDRKGMTPLHRVSQSGRDKFAALLIEFGADVNASNKDGSTPLHLTSEKGHDKVAALLIEFGADVNATRKDIFIARNEENTAVALCKVLFAGLKDGSTPLHCASLKGRDKVAALLIKFGAGVNATDKDGSTALHLASKMGHGKVADLLIKYGADVNATDKDGSTTLHLASTMGHDKVVALLIEYGLDVNATDKNGFTTLHLASQMGHDKVAALLIEFGADVNATDKNGSTGLHLASESGYDKVAALLIEFGANVNATKGDGSTALHLATNVEHDKVAALLIEFGANVNVTNKDGYTPLHLISFNGHDKVAALLIKFGADVNAADKGGSTPLHLASLVGNDKAAAFLIKFGADVNATDKFGYVPLQIACENGHDKVAALLVEFGADANACNRRDQTPLHMACIKGSFEVIKMLIKSEADVNATDKSGSTPLHWACRNKDDKAAGLMIECGADINVRNEDGKTPLHFACENGLLEVTKQFITSRIDLNLTDKYGWTPFRWASSNNGGDDIASLLIEFRANINAAKENDMMQLQVVCSRGFYEVSKLLKKEAHINAADNKGFTPLHHALANGNETIADLLINCGADINALDRNGHTAFYYAKIITHRQLWEKIVKSDVTSKL